MKSEYRQAMLNLLKDYAIVYAYHLYGDESYTSDDLYTRAFGQYRGARRMIRTAGIRESDIDRASAIGKELGERQRMYEIEHGIEYYQSINPDVFIATIMKTSLDD